MYCLISTAPPWGTHTWLVCSPHGFHCRDNKVNAYTGILTYPYTHNKSSPCALHNQYKHLENTALMIYTKYVVLLTQLCMDAIPSCTGPRGLQPSRPARTTRYLVLSFYRLRLYPSRVKSNISFKSLRLFPLSVVGW